MQGDRDAFICYKYKVYADMRRGSIGESTFATYTCAHKS